ncbi:DUF2905 domain-containing protein [Bacteroidetes/Chlorobi group bacterium Naka2016]|nr:MAG: DUF2905 domain-containing protein [Bacteroidetes/Chlorobi group bacterium Naka2016]
MSKVNVRLLLISLGILLIILGLLFPYLTKIPFGRLPGDIVIDRPNIKVFIPITSMIILSIVISIILLIINFLKRQ